MKIQMNISGTLIKSVMAVVVACAVPGSLMAENQTLDHLKQIWTGQASDITTARIKYQFYRSGGKFTIRSDAAIAILDTANLAGHPDDLQKLIESLTGRKIARLADSVDESEFIAEGLKTRMSDAHGVQVFDGESSIIVSDANQSARIEAAASSKYSRLKLSAFRLIPKVAALEGMPVAQDSADTVTLRNSSSELLIDKASGLVLEAINYNGKGAIRHKRWQQGVTLYPGDIYFPKIVMDATFQEGMLYSLSIIIVRDAQFNLTLPPDQFAVAVPKGTNVFDYRQDPQKEAFAKATSDVKDVSAVKTKAFPSHAEMEPRRWTWFTWLNVVAVVLLGVAVTARYVRRRFNLTMDS